MSPYPEIDVHGTPAGYKAGCKTEQMCDDSAPWSCKRAYERYRGDYAFHKRIDEGMTPHEIHELEQADAARLAEEERAWLERESVTGQEKPKKAKAVEPKREPVVADPERLAAYGSNAAAAAQRIASAPEPDSAPRAGIREIVHAIPAPAGERNTLAAALAASTMKEHPMPESLPAGVEWKEPPAAALASSRPRSKNQLIIAAAKAKPGSWLCLGPAAASVATRWRKGEVNGTKPREFEAVVDNGEGKGTKGDLYVRFVGKASA